MQKSKPKPKSNPSQQKVKDVKYRQKVTLTLARTVVSSVDRERGDVNRSMFIQRVLEEKLNIPSE